MSFMLLAGHISSGIGAAESSSFGRPYYLVYLSSEAKRGPERPPFVASIVFDPLLVTRTSPSYRGVLFILPDAFRNRLRLHKLQQIVRSTGFRIRTGHVEPSEGMGAHHGSRALPVDIEVSDKELPFGFFDLRRIVSIYRASEPILSLVC